MGDRANIAVLQWAQPEPTEREKVFLYSHWGGHDLPETLQHALGCQAGRARWNDHAYLARIIFETMIDSDRGGETGYGIATTPPDNEYAYLVLDCETQRVHVAGDHKDWHDAPSLSFEDYCAGPERTWESLPT